MVKSFYWYSKSISNAIEPDWSHVACDEFEEYRMNIYCPDAPHQSASETKIPSARVPTSTFTNRENKGSLVDQFMKGIERDASIFPVLKGLAL